MDPVKISDEALEHYLERIRESVEGSDPMERLLFYQNLNGMLTTRRLYQSGAELMALLQVENDVEMPSVSSLVKTEDEEKQDIVYTIDHFLDRCMAVDETHIDQVRAYILGQEKEATTEMVAQRED